MKKTYFFHLWEIEKLERYLEEMEQLGYRLDHIRWSYWFYFKKSTPKKMKYFLTYTWSRGMGMGTLDYALESTHQAAAVKTQMCYYSMYRTKENEEQLSLLFGARMDYIRKTLLGHALTALFLTAIFAIPLLASMITQSTTTHFWILGIFPGICACLTAYYFYGYFKQKDKCKNYEHRHSPLR